MITQEYLKTILSYNPETGYWLWVIDKGYKIKAGTKAGRIDKSGYVTIKVDNKDYFAHRLAFLYMLAEWPKDQVDHVNRIRHDNTWNNLRNATASENQRNTVKRKDNTSGTKGICKSKNGLFIARLRIGSYKTLEEAEDAYSKVAKLVHAEFYNK